MAAKDKYVNTSKDKAKADAMATNISRQFGYTGAAVKPKATPTAKPKVTPKPKVVKPKPLYSVKPKPNKNWRTAPSDADVIIPGYNDPATIKKMDAAARAKKKTAAQKKKKK